jgi:hypothetical protein
MNAEEQVRGHRKDRMCRTWIALLLVAALLVTGCGGSGGASPATTTANSGALTKAELIQQGDAICSDVYAATAALNPEGTSSEGTRVADLTSDMVKRLLALGIPQETEYSYAEYTTAAHTLAGAAAQVKSAAEGGDAVALRRAEQGSLTALSSFQGYAGQYGFKDCAEGPS